MESYSDMSKDSSSSASYSSTHLKPQSAFRSSLHSVRKNVITKKPIAPLPPIRPKIYKVGRLEFKEVVHRLTCGPDFQQTRLQEVAPPPLSLSEPRRPSEAAFLVGKDCERRRKSIENGFGGLSPLGFSLSPASLAWCSSMLLSPGTLATFEPSVLL